MEYLPKNVKKTVISPEVVKSLPETPGIYIFSNTDYPIYVGKAINLKRRVDSYFDLHLERKTTKMISQAKYLSIIKVNSELEALLLESNLIRKYMPQYNIQAKDDKHPLYIRITKENYPRVITARKISETEKNLAFFGPFPNSSNVKSVLRMLRRIFPYSDHKMGKRGCLYSHIGLCDPCPNEIVQKTENLRQKKLTKQYFKNIRRVRNILSGNFNAVRKEMIKEMEGYSKKQEYEKASEVRNKIRILDYITQPRLPTEFYMQNPNLVEDLRNIELAELKRILTKSNLVIKKLNRIECFDVAHLAGSSAAASMVTFINGEPDKTDYRHFRIRQRKGNSDIGSLKEVITRRLKHIEDWGRPDLIIVDGGKGQVNAFTKILNSNDLDIPVIGIAKNPDRLITGDLKVKLQGGALHLLSRIRDEAHRFAGVYHHKLFSRSLLKPRS